MFNTTNKKRRLKTFYPGLICPNLHLFPLTEILTFLTNTLGVCVVGRSINFVTYQIVQSGERITFNEKKDLHETQLVICQSELITHLFLAYVTYLSWKNISFITILLQLLDGLKIY